MIWNVIIEFFFWLQTWWINLLPEWDYIDYGTSALYTIKMHVANLGPWGVPTTELWNMVGMTLTATIAYGFLSLLLLIYNSVRGS